MNTDEQAQKEPTRMLLSLFMYDHGKILDVLSNA